MTAETITVIICAALMIAATVLSVLFTASKFKSLDDARRNENTALAEALRSLSAREAENVRDLSSRIDDGLSRLRQETATSTREALSAFAETLVRSQNSVFERNDTKTDKLSEHLNEGQAALSRSMNASLGGLDTRFAELRRSVDTMGAELKTTVDGAMTRLRAENEKSLSEIRMTVDEKLQKTLEERISRSFKDVSDRLEQVYKGLGEMQTLAVGVGDLKKVLSNVKTRGTLGEIRLGAILEQIMSPEQYKANVAPNPDSRNFVEYAVLLPGSEEGKTIYLPIDSKFPTDAYYNLSVAYENGNTQEIASAGGAFERRIKDFAKDIRDKYIAPPYTTDFAVMFLPTEGIYAEAVRRGMIEELSKMKITLSGPTTMAALLNSLQMGFKTLAIQKRSSEVWETLGAVKTEFEKFEKVLGAVRTRLEAANKELDTLVTTRTKAIQKKLRGVTALLPENAEAVLSDASDTINRKDDDTDI